MYSHIDNTVYIPSGLVGQPFYDLRWNERLMLASIGWIIAHEVSCCAGFNSSRLQHIIDQRDPAQFSHAIPISAQEARCIDEVETILSVPTSSTGNSRGVVAAAHRANFTLNENMADHYAMHYITTILRNDDQSPQAMTESFIVMAQVWCDWDPETWITTDSHQSSLLRVNATVEMNYPFTNAFECPQRFPVCLQ